MKKLLAGLSVLGLLVVLGNAVGCGEKAYEEPGDVEGIEVDLGDGVPPLDGEGSLDPNSK